ncbi:conserved Plasmodium protein, unknown function [Plasmodium malariae]|uniref:Uncharacterized protein n=1 Tax=Plasmodium malariae TaxID=5858 RepID=A0A1C3L355_PLAMA|nr:conserved Plasmodium protein, unknown function [Plasmodium malariae]
MSYLNKSLSKSINALVLHLEFVKCKNLSDYKKKGKFYLIITYDHLIFYQKDFYEIQFKIFFNEILHIFHCDQSNYVHVTLKENSLTNDIGIKGINKNILIKQLCVGYSTYYMFHLNRNFYMPITKETYEERCNRTKQNSPLKKLDFSIQPFIGYRKIVFDDYFFFMHKSFQNFTTVSSESAFYVDYRGIEICIKIDDKKSMIELEQTADSNFYQLARNHLNFLINDMKLPLVIRRNFYYKKMNLSDDLAKWAGYEIYLKNETHTLVCIIFRRTYIPPLLDKRQDIYVTFRISHQSQQEFDVTDKHLFDEVYVVANSITPNDVHNTYYANLIQVQVDALIYSPEIYEFFETSIKIKPSYFDYIKMFLKSMLIILKEGDVVISSDILDFLGEDTKVERNLEYLLNVILNQISAHKYNIADLIKGAIAISRDNKMAMDNIISFFLHVREKDYVKGYESSCLELLQENDNLDIELGSLLDSNNYSVNDFFLFYLHQCGYINKYFCYKNDDNYKKIIAYILKYGINIKIKKQICKNLLVFSNDYKNKYYALMNSIISFLSNNSDHKNLCQLILSTLINITNENNELKECLLKLNISMISNFLILSNDYDIINKIVLLYINLSKEEYMCDDIINNGLLINFVDILFNIYHIDIKLKKDICINILCILGQFFNYKKYYIFILNHYIGLVDVAIYIYQTTDSFYFDKIKLIFFFKQLVQYSYILKDQVCKHLCPLIIKEIYLFQNNDFIYSSLNLFDVLCDYKINCLYLHTMQILPLFHFIKSINIIDLYKKVIKLEDKVKKNLKIVT